MSAWCACAGQKANDITSPPLVLVCSAPKEVKRRDLSHHERNLDALLQILAEACQSIFNDASEAAARSAVLVAGSVGAARSPEEPRTPRSASAAAPLIRERTVQSGSEASDSLFSTCLCSLAERISTGGQISAVSCNQATA